MDIYVLDKTFKVVSVIDNYISIIWTTRYYTYGDFELYMAADEGLLELLQPGYYLVKRSDMINDEYHHVMIISNRQIQTDAEIGDTLTISGYDLKSLLHRRVIANQTNLKGTVEQAIKQLISDNIINPSDTSRQIPNFNFGTDDLSSTNNVQVQITGQNLGEKIEEICMNFGYGYDVYLENGQFYFYLYEGKDRTITQSENLAIEFSREFDNLLSSDYFEDRRTYANTAIVAGEGEGTARKKVTVGTATGLDRYEIWVDARDCSSNNGEISDAEYNDMLSQRGSDSLSETEITTSFEGNVDNTINYQIGVDYNLGDLVTVANDYGISAATRITEIIESEDENGAEIIPTFSKMMGGN